MSFRSCYLSALLSVYPNFIIRFIVLVIILSFYDGFISTSILIAFLYSLVPVVIGSSLGLFLSIFIVFYRDIENVVQTIAFYLLFASGVFASIVGDSMLVNIVTNLPSYIAVVSARAIILDGLEVDLILMISWFTSCVIVSLLAIFAIRNSKNLILHYLA